MLNKKRIEFDAEHRKAALKMVDLLLESGYDCFIWQCEDNVVVEFEWNRPDFRDGEYVYIDPDKQYVEDYARDEDEGYEYEED